MFGERNARGRRDARAPLTTVRRLPRYLRGNVVLTASFGRMQVSNAQVVALIANAIQHSPNEDFVINSCPGGVEAAAPRAPPWRGRPRDVIP
ncbi:hypothetical protein EVAR_29539_1 [Eumeta japonica]|uniref:Uncharacterized protein n=1 Tax=Eumeta variegata TaxID=151549 RepID=A0A4C1WET0_EUMVA|nr:hypothetical protein EVAR_29539_1 [Eumeta japonica]